MRTLLLETAAAVAAGARAGLVFWDVPSPRSSVSELSGLIQSSLSYLSLVIWKVAIF